MKQLYILALFAWSISVSIPSNGQSIEFSPKQLQSDLNYLFEKLEEIHPDLYHHTAKSKIDSLRAILISEMSVPATRKEFATRVIPIVASLNDAHTSLLFPNEEFNEYHENDGKLFPLLIRVQDGRMYVKENFSADSGIKVNMEINSINGIQSQALLKTFKSFISAELDAYRDVRVERSFQSLLWYVYGFQDEFNVSGSIGTQSYNSKIEGVTVEEIKNKTGSKRKNFYSLYFLEDDKLAVIDFRIMMDAKKFKAFLDSSFSVIQNKGVENLVIDIRNNGGGNSRLGDMLFGYITDKPYKMADTMDVKISKTMKRHSRKNFVKWYMYPLYYTVGFFHPMSRMLLLGKNGTVETFSYQKMLDPENEKLKFLGNTFLLTSRITFSSASMLAAAFKCYEMGTVVGEETGGVLSSYGDIIAVFLPNTGIKAYCSYKRFVLPCFDGKIHGVIPDVEIKPSIEDIMQGNDPEMRNVIKTINSGNFPK